MKKKLIILGIAVLGLSSCKEFKEGDGGLLYKFHTDESGETIKPGDFVALMAIQKTDQDSVIYNSYDYDRPNIVYGEEAHYKGDFNAGLALLSEGDSATFKIRVDSIKASVKKTGGAEPNIKGEYMIYTLKILKVIPRGKDDDNAFQAKVQDFFKVETEKAKGGEAAKIKAYIASKNLKTLTTPSGLNYVITKQGSGPNAAPGDTVEVNYTGTLMSGKVFDSSLPEIANKSDSYDAQRPYAPIKVPVGANSAIAGFEEALTLFPVGTKATIILPSQIAYGEQGGAFPPYTSLIFDIEVLNIIHPKAAK